MLISSVSTTSYELITGAFKIHIDDSTYAYSNAVNLISFLDLANLTQYVPSSTHCGSYTLDLSLLVLSLF
jgi:hypothetical protein